LFEKRISKGFPLFQKSLGTEPGQVSYPGDIAGALRNTDCPPRVEEIKDVGTFQAAVIGWQDKIFPGYSHSLHLVHIEKISEHADISLFKVINGPFNFTLVMDIAI
jgi:hypothetical protein